MNEWVIKRKKLKTAASKEFICTNTLLFTRSLTRTMYSFKDERTGGRVVRLCNGSANISSFTIYLWMERTRCISGWDCSACTHTRIVVNGKKINCNAIDHASAPLLIFPQNLFSYVSNETCETDASSSQFTFFIYFEVLIIFFSVINFRFKCVSMSITAHTSAQFYSHFSSKHVEKCVRIFICIIFEVAGKRYSGATETPSHWYQTTTATTTNKK